MTILSIARSFPYCPIPTCLSCPQPLSCHQPHSASLGSSSRSPVFAAWSLAVNFHNLPDYSVHLWLGKNILRYFHMVWTPFAFIYIYLLLYIPWPYTYSDHILPCLLSDLDPYIFSFLAVKESPWANICCQSSSFFFFPSPESQCMAYILVVSPSSSMWATATAQRLTDLVVCFCDQEMNPGHRSSASTEL